MAIKIKRLIKKSPEKTKEEVFNLLVGNNYFVKIPTGRSVYYIIRRGDKNLLKGLGFKKKIKNRNARFAFTEENWLLKITKKSITIFQKKPDKVWIKRFK